MKFQVDGEEYMALLALKSTVEVVLKVWDSSKDFATPDSIDVFFDYLRKDAVNARKRERYAQRKATQV